MTSPKSAWSTLAEADDSKLVWSIFGGRRLLKIGGRRLINGGRRRFNIGGLRARKIEAQNLRKSRFVAHEWKRLEDWHGQIRQFAELLQLMQKEKKQGRPETRYLRVILEELLKGEKLAVLKGESRKKKVPAKLVGENISIKELAAQKLTRPECDQVVQKLAEVYKKRLKTPETDNELEQKIALAIVTVLGSSS